MSENTISSEYEIDEDIRDLVNFCNNNGIKTLASCSGTRKDHRRVDGPGQLNIQDSSLARKIVAVIIERGICKAELISRPADPYFLYDNKISYPHINLNFDNPDNEVLPKIEEIFRQVVEKEIEPSKETLDKINKVFNCFNSITRKINATYNVMDPSFSGELTFHTSNIKSYMRVDLEALVGNLAELTGKSILIRGYDKGISVGEIESLDEILNKARVAIQKTPNISVKEEREKRKAQRDEVNIGTLADSLRAKVYSQEERDARIARETAPDSWMLEDINNSKSFSIEDLLGHIE